MSAHDEVQDSPTDWVAQHVHRYVETGGQSGHEWQPGVPTLLITTRGRKSGTLHRTALIYGRDGDRYLVVASRGGSPLHPSWYLNLVDHPEVDLQVGPAKFSARARTADADEKPRLWSIMASIWPDYDSYQSKTNRDIPVVILEPTDG